MNTLERSYPTRAAALPLGIAGLLLAAGCSQPAMDTAAAPDMTVIPPDMTDVYPPGPYSWDEGGVAPDFVFKGYFSTEETGLASAQEFGEVRFDQLRRSGLRYMFLAAGAYW